MQHHPDTKDRIMQHAACNHYVHMGLSIVTQHTLVEAQHVVGVLL